MALGEIRIPAPNWQPLDGSTNNATPASVVIAGTATQKVQVPVWSFDGNGGIEYICYSSRVPVNYLSGGVLQISWTINSTTASNVVWQAQVQAITPADADTPLEHAWSTAAAVVAPVNTVEARRLSEASLVLNMDSAAAGDMLSILFFRDSTHSSDTSTVDAEMISIAFQYTANTPTAPTLWTPMAGAYQNSWVDYRVAGGHFTPGQYRKTGNDVEIRGLIKSGSSDATFFTVPVGYQPVESHLFPMDHASNTHGRVEVGSDNAMIIRGVGGGGNTYADVYQMRWSTAANGSDGWVAVSGGIGFTNSWSNYGGGWCTAAYRKVGDIVEVRGLLAGGTIGTSAFTLPVGYRPVLTHHWGADTATNAHGQLVVDASGNVIPVSGSNGYYGLFNIRFSVSAVGTNGWTALSFAGGWSNYDANNYIPAEYRIVGDMVELRGLVAGGSGLISTLPTVARPAWNQLWCVEASNAHGRLDVQPDGVVYFSAGTATYVSLSGVRFSMLP